MKCKMCSGEMKKQVGLIQPDPIRNVDYKMYACVTKGCKLEGEPYCGKAIPMKGDRADYYAEFVASLGAH